MKYCSQKTESRTLTKIITQNNRFNLKQVTAFFENVVTPGYLNSDNYDIEITEEYKKDFIDEVNSYFAQNLDKEGYIDFSMRRFYAMARKEVK